MTININGPRPHFPGQGVNEPYGEFVIRNGWNNLLAESTDERLRRKNSGTYPTPSPLVCRRRLVDSIGTVQVSPQQYYFPTPSINASVGHGNTPDKLRVHSEAQRRVGGGDTSKTVNKPISQRALTALARCFIPCVKGNDRNVED